uniref:Natterin-like protein n=1 Tax=Adineta vaga TaxID=104782 RepID=B3G4H0_ADIVA|nr:natterin-like protein [Adineta vaga]
MFIVFVFILVLKDLLKGDPHGFNTDNAFNDIDEIGYDAVYTPRLIIIKAGSSIDAIQINYGAASGIIRQASQHGGTGGSECKFSIDADERIVKVEGSVGTAVSGLMFTTNKGRKSPRCGAAASNKDFVEQYPGYVLSYISGRSGNYLNQIRFYWTQEEQQYTVSSVVYDLTNAQITQSGTPRTVFNTVLTNYSPLNQKQTYAFTYTTSRTQSFTFSAELSVGVETTLKCGIPILAEGTVKVSASITVGFSYGSQTTEEKSNQYALEVVVPANSTMDASMFVIEGTVEVPFTSHLTIKYSDGTEDTRDNQVGTYRGVMASNANVVFGVAKPITSSPDGNTKVISG